MAAIEKEKALDAVRQMVADGQVSQEVAEKYFPELKSEDERIRNLLYCLIRDRSDNRKLLENNGVSVDMALAWIEKQDDKNLVQETEPTPIFRIGDTLKRKGKDYTFIVDRIQGGYYHCDHSNGAFFPIEEQDNWELIEQNHWSEEDEYCIHQLIVFCENCMVQDTNAKKCADWLKSLKDRVQPKQEWSEEDEIRINSILSSLLYCNEQYPDKKEYLKDINWLKSLIPQKKQDWSKEDEGVLVESISVLQNNSHWVLADKLKSIKYKVQPQSRWKPNKLQIEALDTAIHCGIESGTWEEEALKDLIEQLKRLKE